MFAGSWKLCQSVTKTRSAYNFLRASTFKSITCWSGKISRGRGKQDEPVHRSKFVGRKSWRNRRTNVQARVKTSRFHFPAFAESNENFPINILRSGHIKCCKFANLFINTLKSNFILAGEEKRSKWFFFPPRKEQMNESKRVNSF